MDTVMGRKTQGSVFNGHIRRLDIGIGEVVGANSGDEGRTSKFNVRVESLPQIEAQGLLDSMASKVYVDVVCLNDDCGEEAQLEVGVAADQVVRYIRKVKGDVLHDFIDP